jgi:hypothetical protein
MLVLFVAKIQNIIQLEPSAKADGNISVNFSQRPGRPGYFLSVVPPIRENSRPGDAANAKITAKTLSDKIIKH